MVISPQKKLEVLPPFLKEQAHHLPADFTKHETCTDRDRRRLLGNSWHKGIASFLFRIVLEHGMFVVEDPGKAPSDPSQSGSIKEALAGIRASKFPITRVKTPVFRRVPPATDMWDHWRGSEYLQPNASQSLPLEPGLEVVLDIVSRLQASALDSYRARVLSEVQRLVQALRQDTDQWYASVPHHVARTLHPHGHSRFEVLAFTKLLRDCGYPDISALEEDFRTGFPLLGELRHTPGWRPRLDDTYANPRSLEAFKQLNQHHVHEKLKHSRLDPHWQHMLEEVLQEVDAGRMEGPFVGPADWPKKTVGVASRGMLPVPRTCGECFVARAFSVSQVGADGNQKIRRCEDSDRIIIPPFRWETVLSMTTSRCTSACSVEHAPLALSHTSGVRTFRMRTGRIPFRILAMRTCCWEQQQGRHFGGTGLCHSDPRLQCGILTGSLMPFAGFADACS